MLPLLALMPGKFKLALAGIAAVGLVVGYFYVANLQLKVKNAELEKATLHSVIDAQKLQIDDTAKSIAKMGQINTRINQDFQKAQKESADLRKKLDSTRLRELGATDPKLLEQKVNRGTQNALRCNELASGAELVPSDAGNPICPDLVKSVPVPKSPPTKEPPKTVSPSTEKDATNLLNKLKKAQ